MKGYKGFGPGMICRGKQYQENTEFTEPEAKICKSGMHFCKNPFDVWDFYPPTDENGNLNEFAEVEALAGIKDNGRGCKYCTTRLRIGKRLNLLEFINASIDFITRHAKNIVQGECIYGAAVNADADSVATTNMGGRSVAVNTGIYSVAMNHGARGMSVCTSNYSAVINAGYGGGAVATGDYCASSVQGVRGVAASLGRRSAAVSTDSFSVSVSTNDYSVAVNNGGTSSTAVATGDFNVAYNNSQLGAALSTGMHTIAVNAGDSGAALSTGHYSSASVSGDNAVAITTGNNGKVKGAVGCWIACAEWGESDTGYPHPVAFKSVLVDGTNIKADTWYMLKNGEFVEVIFE